MTLIPKERTAKKNIYNVLRREILNGKRRPGERLAIDALKAEFGTSVTPVRDALQMLSQEALITIKPRSGYFVSRITLKELRDMMELREVLELAAVEKAAKNISVEQLEELRKVNSGYTGDGEGSYTRYNDENKKFHCLVAKASKNMELAAALAQLLDRLARFMVISHSGRELTDIHEPLIKSLELHDAEGGKKSLLKELTHTRYAVMERIMQEEAAFWHVGGGNCIQ